MKIDVLTPDSLVHVGQLALNDIEVEDAARSLVATLLRAGQLENVAQCIKQCGARVNMCSLFDTIDVQL